MISLENFEYWYSKSKQASVVPLMAISRERGRQKERTKNTLVHVGGYPLIIKINIQQKKQSCPI
jgi:hypothetical protein